MKAEIEGDYVPMTVKEAVALLSSLQPSQVLLALRHNDFAMLAGLAFQGFRMDAGGYANPIVRRRLAEEAAKNNVFAEKLRDLAKHPAPPSAPLSPKPVSIIEKPVEPSHEAEKYRVERDRLKQEREAAVAARQGAERQLMDAKRQLIATLAGKAESDREIERLKQRIERMERKQRQLETTNAALRRAAILPPPPPPAPVVEPAAPPVLVPTERYFVEAVRHLLGKDRGNVALSLVNDVLRATPDDVDALEIKVDALIKAEKTREALPVLRSLVTLHLKHDAITRASAALYKLLMASAQPAQESRLIRELMSALLRTSGNTARLVEPINALRIDNPAAFSLVRSLTPPAIQQVTFPEQTTFAPDAPLPLALSAGLAVTSRRLVAAIERNDRPIVELSQEALRNKDVEEREKILASITRAADGETVYGRVLAPKFSRGPVIVDASNVAWHGQEALSHQQPRLEYILAIRRTLWAKGYFPVVLMADANLPYVVNDLAMVRKMVEEEQIQLVIGGSDADEHILREARRLFAPVITNDYMADWDPDQTVIKIQYSFTPDGKPTVYF